MGTAVEHIKNDHGYIMKSLVVLQNIFMGTKPSVIIDKTDLSECIKFNTVFTCMCHNGKEDTILFKNLMDKGAAIIGNEIKALSVEHQACCKYIKSLQDLFPYNTYELISPRFITSIVGYINHVESHIKKENGALFTIIDHYLSGPEQEMVCAKFNEYEKYINESCSIKEIKSTMDYLSSKYATTKYNENFPCGYEGI